MDANHIISLIVAGEFDNVELEKITGAVVFARKGLQRQAVRTFSPGDTVKFTHPGTGREYRGAVTKVNRKYIMVNTGATVYRVPGNMLQSV